VLAQQPNAPVWMLIKPLPFRHADSLQFDTKALTFIFDRPDGPDVFNKVMTVEIKYHAFFHLLLEHRKVAEDAQNVLSEKHPDPTQPRPIGELGRTLGFARVARMESVIKALLRHVEKDEEAYREAVESLPKLLKQIFKEGVVRATLPTDAQLERSVVE
jgi:hypothetical protein